MSRTVPRMALRGLVFFGCCVLLAGCVTRTSLSESPFRSEMDSRKEAFDSFMAEGGDIEYRAAKSHVDGLMEALPRLRYPEEGLFPEEPRFTLELRDANLENALNLIADMGGKTLFFVGDFGDPVEYSFEDASLDEPFKHLLEAYDCLIEEQGEAYRITRHDPGACHAHVFTLNTLSAVELLPAVETMLDEEHPPVVGPEGTTLLVMASPEVLDRVALFLDSIDRAEPQVIIEARILEIVISDLLEYGSEHNFSNIHIDDTTSQFISSFLPDSDNASFYFAGDKAAIESTLRALHELTRVDVLSRPRIMAKNGEEAKIDVIEEIPYIDSTTTTTGTSDGVGTATVEEVEFKEVGLKFTVTPQVKADGTVELKISQDVSEQMGTFNDIPVIDRRVVDTRLEVKDGEMVVIGGLIRTQNREEVSGIPFLMDIPLLGYLFKVKKNVTEQRELMIMLTPRIL